MTTRTEDETLDQSLDILDDVFDRGSSFLPDDDGIPYQSDNPYGSLHEIMEKFTRHQMDTLLGFVQSGVLTTEQSEYMAELLPIGMFQYTACLLYTSPSPRDS